MLTPVKQPTDGQTLDVDNRTYNALLRGLRCLGERGFALLTGRWRALRHFTTSPRKIGDIVKAELARRNDGKQMNVERGAVRLGGGDAGEQVSEQLNRRRVVHRGGDPGGGQERPGHLVAGGG